MKHFTYAGIAALSSLLLLTACDYGAGHGELPGDIKVLTISTADSSGTMYPVGDAIAKSLSTSDLQINVEASTGSAMNAELLNKGEVDLALISGDVASAYMVQNNTAENMQAIAAVFVSVSTWIGPDNGDALYVHDLQSKRIGIGPEGSATELAALAALTDVGLGPKDITTENCGLKASIEKIKESNLDALHSFTGVPVSSFTDLMTDFPCRILGYTREELDNIVSHGNYTYATIPAGTYPGQTQDVDTFGVKCLLCVNASMDEAMVYALTEALWNQRANLAKEQPCMKVMLDENFCFEDIPIPLHPEAKRFYMEQTGNSN